jgi:hypothetical protein
MRTLSRTTALLTLGVLASALPGQAQLLGTGSGARGGGWGPEVQLWLDGGREQYLPGDPVRVRFRTSERAWVAVLHVDPTGRLSLLHPSHPGVDNHLVPGRTYTLPQGSATAAWRLGPARGIGYFFAVASRQPLDFTSLRRSLRLSDGLVRGDPFLVMEQVAETLRPRGSREAPFLDAIAYRVGSGHRWPAYACWDGIVRPGSYLFTAAYLDCGYLPRLLVREPGYYDPVRYRGDRSRLLREVAPPAHGSKHRGPAAAPAQRPAPVASSPRPAGGEEEPRTRPAPATQPAEGGGRSRPRAP